jgi:hypothetical protein
MSKSNPVTSWGRQKYTRFGVVRPPEITDGSVRGHWSRRFSEESARRIAGSLTIGWYQF